MNWLNGATRFLVAMAASLLPHRHWAKLPASLPVEIGAFASGIATLMAGMAVGIPGFLNHAAAGSSLGTSALIGNALKNHEVSLSPGFNSLSIFTFLFFTPQGWLTMYLLGTGTYRAAAAYFEDPFGEPVLTGIDDVLFRRSTRRAARQALETRESLEGPEVQDRVVSAAAAGIPECDFAIVSSRRKPGWERGASVYTQHGCFRIGEPVERTINGRLRTLYPLKQHADLEAVRRFVRYDLPPDFTR